MDATAGSRVSAISAVVNMKMTPREFNLMVEALGEASHALFKRSQDPTLGGPERRAARETSTQMAALQKKLM